MSLRDVTVESKDIPLGLIDAPRLTSRVQMDEGKLEELARNIQQNGLLEPLIVFPVADRYAVAAGHRRLLASTRAGLVAVPCRVYYSEERALEAAKHAENRFREELTPAEEAVYFDELLERDFGGDVDALAAHLGETRSYVESRVLLFRGGKEVFDALLAGKIGLGVAQELNKCTDDNHRAYLLDIVIRGGATKAVVTGYIQQWQSQQRLTSGTPAPVSGGERLAPVAETNYFTCYACGGTEHVEAMRPVNIHSHCKLAILDKALEQYQRRGDALLWPRTLEEALELAAKLIEDFPQLVTVNPSHP